LPSRTGYINLGIVKGIKGFRERLAAMAATEEQRIAVRLDDRAVIALGGADARGFLQGLVTNDVAAVAPDRAVYAALLTPQGKVLFDFFLFEIAGVLHVDCAADAAAALAKRLSMYRLRADVTIEDARGALAVTALPWDGAAAAVGLDGAEGACCEYQGGAAYVDPRCAAMGVRLCLPAGVAADVTPGPAEAYRARRIALGIAEGAELAVGRGLPLEAGLDELHGIAFDKGCYVGQEVTARMKSRGLVRNRVMPVRIEGAPPAADAPIRADGAEAGELRVLMGAAGLAMMKLEALERAEREGLSLTAGDARVTVTRPPWSEA
jgi:folate-binding protein YgfZ